MTRTLRHALLPLLFAAAGTASASVITLDGVVFTTTYTGNVLTLQIDAAGRTGGWAGATAIDALGIKNVGSFGGVKMTSRTGADWAFSSNELNSGGCSAAGNGNGNGNGNGKKDKSNKSNKENSDTADGARICYTGGAVNLADNMVFTFAFEGTPSLGAPHLKVQFVDAKGNKVGDLLSRTFDWQAETIPAQPGNGSNQGGGADTGGTGDTGGSGNTGGSSGSQEGGAGETGTGDTGTGDTGTGTPGGVTTPETDPPVLPPELFPTPGDNASEGGNVDTPPSTTPSGDIPEPQTLATIGAGLAMMGLVRRRSRARRKTD